MYVNDIEAKDANMFFGHALEYLRDLEVDMIVTSTYDILTNLGYSRLRK